MQTIFQTDKFIFVRVQIKSFFNLVGELRSEIVIESFHPLLKQTTTAESKPQNFNFITVKLMMKFRFDLFMKNLCKIEYEIFFFESIIFSFRVLAGVVRGEKKVDELIFCSYNEISFIWSENRSFLNFIRHSMISIVINHWS